MGIRDGLARILGVQERSQGYTATIQQAVARAIRDPGATVASTAAVQFGMGLLVRAFAVSDLRPDLVSLGARFRASMIQDLVTTGNHVSLLQVQGGRMWLHRASQWDVDGGYDPQSWIYRLTLPGPTRTDSVQAMADQVVHVRYMADADRPWMGVSPLASAGVSADLLSLTERSLRHEMQAIAVGMIVHPNGYLPNQDRRAEFGQALANADRQLLVEAGDEGWRRQGQGGSWEQVRLGPQPDAQEVALRSQVAQDVLSAMGIPAGLYAPREGAVSRESYRQLLSACILPYAELCLEELRRVLEMPELRLGFHRLAAADVAARARAYGSLTQAGVAPESAARIAGIEDAEMRTSPGPAGQRGGDDA